MIPTLFYRLKDAICKIGADWDRLALNEANVIDFAEEHINKEPEKFQAGSSSVYSMEYCLAHSGESINERYRTDRTEDIDRKIAAALDTHRTDADLIVYRGVCDYVFDLMKENAKGHSDTDLFEKGFMATSLVKTHELNYKKKLRIFVPAGSKCVYMGNVNDELGFYEVTIQHDAALKIISIDKDYINCRLLRTA